MSSSKLANKKRSGVIEQIVLDKKKYLIEFSESESAVDEDEAI